MGVGNGGDQAVRAFDRHILIGRQIVRPVDVIGVQPAQLARRDQLVAFCVAAHSADQRGRQAETGQGHRNVQGDAAGQARDAPRHIRALPHLGFSAPDDVPQDRADAKNVWLICHAARFAHTLGRAQVRMRSGLFRNGKGQRCPKAFPVRTGVGFAHVRCRAQDD